jgi:hypothetical protein
MFLLTIFPGTGVAASPTPAQIIDPTNASSMFGWAMDSAGDVNGDGYDDVVVGAYSWNGSFNREGRAYLHLGSASGLAETPAWTADPTDVTDAWFGWAVSTAGDVNGDGYSDVAISAPFWRDEHAEGRAYVYLGSADGLPSEPSWTADPTDQDISKFGWSLSSAGDVNADGYSDLIIGARDWNGEAFDEGRAYLYLGGPTGLASTPAWTIDPVDQEDGRFGLSVAMGRVNGDDYSDIVVSAGGYNGEAADEGRVYLFPGGASGPSSTPLSTVDPSDVRGATFGLATSVGDVNGDGFDDVIANTFYPYLQTIYLLTGGVGGLSSGVRIGGNGSGTLSSISATGDTNADGYADIVVGAEENSREVGTFLGGPGGPGSYPDLITVSTNPTDEAFGDAVAAGGDINGDGFSDLIVGAPGWDGASESEGRIYVYFNRPPSIAPIGDKTFFEGRSYSLPIHASDVDNDQLTYSGHNLPAGARAAWRNFSWTPTYSQAGTYDVSLVVSDGRSERTETFSIEVVARPKPGSVTTLSVRKTPKLVEMKGTVTPRHSGHKVSMTLSRKRNGVFRFVGKQVARLGSLGRFEASFDRARPGKCKALAVFGGDWNSRASRDRVYFDC